jgi:hypothetical protein
MFPTSTSLLAVRTAREKRLFMDMDMILYLGENLISHIIRRYCKLSRKGSAWNSKIWS